jgi:hypothetical protein
VDSAVALKPGEAEVSLLFEQLFELESNLNAWLRAHLQQHYASTSENETENISPPPPPPSSATYHTKTTVFNLTLESLCRISLLLTSESLADLSRHHRQLTTLPISSPEVAAASLCHTTTLLASAAKTPINCARVVSGPLHFLKGFFARNGDEAGLRWCAGMKGRVCGDKGAEFLRWDALLPWCLLDFHRRSEAC